MPTYTYQCQKCGDSQDEFHGMSVLPKVKCGSCGSVRMRKMPGKGAGIIFKGSGFYETDYKRAGAKDGGEEKGSKTETKGEAKGTTQGETKTDTKSEAASSSSSKSPSSSGGKKAAAST